MYLFYDQIELELVGYCQSCHLENFSRIQTLYTVDHELPVLSLYLYSHNKVFADINQNNIAQ